MNEKWSSSRLWLSGGNTSIRAGDSCRWLGFRRKETRIVHVGYTETRGPRNRKTAVFLPLALFVDFSVLFI